MGAGNHGDKPEEHEEAEVPDSRIQHHQKKKSKSIKGKNKKHDKNKFKMTKTVSTLDRLKSEADGHADSQHPAEGGDESEEYEGYSGHGGHAPQPQPLPEE